MGVGLRGPCIRMTREDCPQNNPSSDTLCRTLVLERIPAGPAPNVRCLHCSPLSGDYLTLQHAGTA